MTDYKEDLDKAAPTYDLETIKCIILNMKLNKGNEEVLTLLNSGIKVNLIS